MTPRDILDFWFGKPDAPSYGEKRQIWFEKNEDFDEEIRERFLPAVKDALDGGLSTWEGEPEGCLALIILLDQFPRNLFRGTARAFDGDMRALELAKKALAEGYDRKLLPLQRLFLYLPLEHSEDLADQDRSVALLEKLSQETDDPGWHHYAVLHRDIIARFGRFPHRNTALGREMTEEEKSFLTEPNSAF